MSCHKWLVLAAAHCCAILTNGFVFSFGNLFADIMETFDATRASAGSVQSVVMAFGLSIGFVNGLLIQRFGLRKVSLIAAICASFGTAVCFFANSVPFLIVFVSFVMSLGTSCLFIATPTATGLYFHSSNRMRFVVLTVIQIGTGIGSVLYPYLLRYLADEYGLRGTFLIVGGMLMNDIPLSFLFHPPRKPRTKRTKHAYLNTAYDAKEIDVNEEPSMDRSRPRIENGKEVETKNANELRGTHLTRQEACLFTDKTKKSLQQLKDHSTKRAHNDSENVHVNKEVVIENKTSAEEAQKNSNTFRSSFTDVFRNTPFTMFAFGLALSYQAVLVLIIFAQDVCLDAGFTKQDASFAILMMYSLSVFGILTPGFLFQTSCTSTFAVPILADILVIAAQAGTMTVKSFGLMVAFVCVAGFSFGMQVSMFSVMPVRFFDINKLSVAVGLLMTLSGIIIAGFGPMAGWLRDYTGTYIVPFATSLTAAMIGFILFVFGHINRLRAKKRNRNAVTQL